MDILNANQYSSYSWHQSHDQATVLLLLPYETSEDETVVMIEREHLIAGVRGQPLVVKGRLYGTVDQSSSSWQLEPRASRLSTRERTISTTSTASSAHSSYAFVSDAEISSSFAASLNSGNVSEADEPVTPSPAYSSPVHLSGDERAGPPYARRNATLPVSGSASPRIPARSLTSSFSSLESLQSSYSGRLLTIHLEKTQSMIWPAMIVGPAPETLSPLVPNPLAYEPDLEYKYNMDPTSLVLMAVDQFDIRRNKDEAFECFVRAWHQAHVPAATMRLVTFYLPLQASFDIAEPTDRPRRGTHAYYTRSLGGSAGLAQLYLEAGLMHLEGAASALLSSSSSTLSSIRIPPPHPPEQTREMWFRDRDAARRYFDRARALEPALDVPLLHPSSEASPSAMDLEMPSIEIRRPGAADSAASASEAGSAPGRRRRKERASPKERVDPEEDHSWYLFVPGLVGAGTALLVVGVVSAISLSNWRRDHSS